MVFWDCGVKMPVDSCAVDDAADVDDALGRCILRTHDLTLRYGRNLAVDALSLNVHRGEIYGFLGRNGAGKTSTIRMIMGICKPDNGSIEFDGKSLRRIKNKQKRMIGYVSQEQYFYPWMTCAGIGKFVGGLYPTWEVTEFGRLMNVLELPPDRKIAHLSGGMRVKLALALALAHRPPILILDEPTAGLDPVARREFLDIIRLQSKQHNRTTFFSSHLIDEVERVADRVGIIHRAKLQFEGPLGELHETVREVPLPETESDPSQTMPQMQDPQTQDPQTQDPEDQDPEIRIPAGNQIADTPSLPERASQVGLRYLRRGLDGRPTLVYQGTAEAWERGLASGIDGTPMSLEDAFIALASEDVGRV
jgi:ABC-2 type transport system ATP-binding protein